MHLTISRSSPAAAMRDQVHPTRVIPPGCLSPVAGRHLAPSLLGVSPCTQTHPEDGSNPHILIQISLQMLHPSLLTPGEKFFCLNAKFWLVWSFFFKDYMFPAPKISHLYVIPLIFYSFFQKQCPNTLCDSRGTKPSAAPRDFLLQKLHLRHVAPKSRGEI